MHRAGVTLLCAALAVLAARPGGAQDHAGMDGHAQAAPDATASPYAGLEQRPIKGLSAQQVADLEAGRGMGLALAAELNGYPGPRHVLELAAPLGLSERQRVEAAALFAAMTAEAIALGRRLIAEEEALDRLFAERRMTPAALTAATARIAALQGELRAAHLRYHLVMMDLLSPDQVARYAALRGYAAGRQDAGADP